MSSPDPTGVQAPRRAVLFESYGRGDASEAAREIKRTLQEKGFEVWLDQEHLSPTERDFWHPIEQALKGSEVVVALLSPTSRRLEGEIAANPRMSVCHNELLSAVRMDKTIVCATVVDCKPPLAIVQYDPIPFTDWQSSPDAYRRGIEEILHWIQEGLASNPRRRYSSYVDNLSQDKLSFPEELTASDGFVGREWLIQGRLRQWLHSGSRCLMIEADTGTGKTALVAELVRRNVDERIFAYHFCNSQNQDTVKPERFVRSIAAMLSGTLPEYRDRLKTTNVISALKRDNAPQTMLWQGVLEPLHTLDSAKVGYIVVDGLDEAAGAGSQVTIPRLLSHALADFPRWLKLVVTARRDDRVPRFASAERYVLTGEAEEQKQDLRQFIERRCLDPALRGVCHDEGEQHRLVQAVIERSVGNFQYARTVFDELASGRLQPEKVGTLPASLADLYDARASAMFPESVDFEPARTILGVLMAAREPLNRAQLAQITNFDRSTLLRSTLDRLTMFVTWDDGAQDRYFRIAHKSIADWLTDRPGGSDRFRIVPAEGRKSILVHCRNWATHHETYALTHLVAHLLIPDDLPDGLMEVLALLRGDFFAQRRLHGISPSQDLFDTRTLVLSLVERRDAGAIVALSKTANLWQRDGVAAGLQAAPKAADEFVYATVGELLKVA